MTELEEKLKKLFADHHKKDGDIECGGVITVGITGEVDCECGLWGKLGKVIEMIEFLEKRAEFWIDEYSEVKW